MIDLEFTLNGKARSVSVEPNTTLLEVLRESLLLTGSKDGCGVGECGACMVLKDGVATPSCLVLAPDAAGSVIETVEGFAVEGSLSPVQAAFGRAGAVQCGFCTPGMIVTATALLRERREPTEEEIRAALAGVLCRCGTYPKVIEAFRVLAGRGDP